MKVIKKILKVLLATAGVIFILVVGAVLVVLWKPELVVNRGNLERGANYLRDKDILDVRWNDETQVNVKSLSFLRKRFQFDFRDFCFDLKMPRAEGCLNRARLEAVLDFSALIPKITVLGPVALLGGEIAYDSTVTSPEDPEPASKDSSPFEWPPAILKHTRLEPIVVDIPTLNVKLSDGRIDASIALDIQSKDDGLRLNLKTKEKLWVSDQWQQRGEVTVQASTPTAHLKGPWRVVIEGDTRLRDGLSAGLKGTIQQKGEAAAFAYDLQGSYRQGSRRVTAGIDGRIDEAGIEGVLNARATGLADQIGAIQVAECRYSLKGALLESTGAAGPGKRERAGIVVDDGGHIKLNCPLEIGLPKYLIKDVPNLELPQRMDVNIHADLRSTSVIPSADENIEGQVRIEMHPLRNDLLLGSGSIAAELGGVPSRFPQDWKLDGEAAVKLGVSDFQNLVGILKLTPYAVPAPLNVLQGQVSIATEGKLDLQGGAFPIAFSTKMRSEHQSLNIDSDGKVQVRKEGDEYKGHVDLDVVLSDVRISLPRLSATDAPPQLLPDSRIQDLAKAKSEASEETKPSSFTFNVTVKTPSGMPVRLNSNLTEKPIPIHLDLKSTAAEGAQGKIRVADFPVKLFRREATVEKFILTLPGGEVPQTVDGAVSIKYVDYTIRVLVLGTTDAPQIVLQSDPPLPDNQIVAVLLFGEPMDELDPEKQESVGNFQSAVAGKAIGLASLYLFASTPIQSVNYDPATGAVSARVRLAEGTSLSVGKTEADAATVGLRKRLGTHWTLSTEVVRSTKNLDPIYSAFLEWTNRY